MLGEHVRERLLDRLDGRAEVHRRGAPLAAPQHVEAHVGGDAVEPRPQGGPALEATGTPPGPDHRVLHGVFGLEEGTEHPVAVTGKFHAVLLQVF